MKQLFFLLVALFIASTAGAQKATIDNVPDTVANAFKAKFSIAEKVKWFIDDDNYQAEFKVSKVDFTATFNKSGKWLMTEKFIKSSELPKAVRESVLKEFGQLSAYTFDAVERVETTEQGTVYQMVIEKGELVYKMVISETGEILKKEEKKES